VKNWRAHFNVRFLFSVETFGATVFLLMISVRAVMLAEELFRTDFFKQFYLL